VEFVPEPEFLFPIAFAALALRRQRSREEQIGQTITAAENALAGMKIPRGE
jgi:hypothetical protein